jgi:hypothetical protein
VVGHGRNLWEVICFFCESKGHLKQDCPKPKFKAWWLENKGKGASGQPGGAKKAEGEREGCSSHRICWSGKYCVDDFALTTLCLIFFIGMQTQGPLLI